MFGYSQAFLFYTDPGSGALLLQLLMAAAFGALFYFRRVRDKVFGLFRRKDGAESEQGTKESITSKTSEEQKL